MKAHPSGLSLDDLRDELLAGAECLYDPELHTGPEDGTEEHPSVRAAREAVAREVCASCPVRVLCLEYALRTRPGRGIWAGLDASEIGALAARRALGEVA